MGILTVGDTRIVRPFDVVEAEASRLVEGPLPSAQAPPEVPDHLRSRGKTAASDQEASIRGRLADKARQQGKRRHLLKILERPTPPWNPADHPELDAEGGAAAWVKRL